MNVSRVPQWRSRVIILVVLLMAAVLVGRVSFMFGAPPAVGLIDGRLRPCPSSPNCVCSQDTDAGHAIAPLTYSGDASVAWGQLKDVIRGFPRTRLISGDDHYLRVEFTTAIFRFVDDVEFLLDENSGTIEVRSASRVGHSDLGTNRKRVELVRQRFASALQSAVPDK